jgi:molybdopterin converting factor small subunit
MVEIRYKDQHEVTNLAGLTVSEAREKFSAEFGIPDKATAKLNGNKVKGSAEFDTVINDDDKLTFATSKGVGAYLVGAVLLALAVTGSVFAFGFINGTATLNAAGQLKNNFADVTANSTGIAALSWNAYGYYKGKIDCGPTANNGTSIFNIDTFNSGYTGDLVVTVSLGNADDLAKAYRQLSLTLVMCDQTGASMDISAGNGSNFVILTLDNGSVSMYPTMSGNMTTVRVKNAFYITHAKPNAGWGNADPSPDLFCEVAQR